MTTNKSRYFNQGNRYLLSDSSRVAGSASQRNVFGHRHNTSVSRPGKSNNDPDACDSSWSSEDLNYEEMNMFTPKGTNLYDPNSSPSKPSNPDVPQLDMDLIRNSCD